MGTISWEKRNFGAAYLRRILFYGPTTGYWFWQVDRSRRIKAGSKAGYLNNGYWEICIDGIYYMATNLAWLYMTNEWPPVEIDHKNRSSSDDRWENLRLATDSQQAMNRGLRSTNTSGVTGVSWDRALTCWKVCICINYRLVHLGYFKTFEEATDVRRAAEIKYFGEFAPSYAAE